MSDPSAVKPSAWTYLIEDIVAYVIEGRVRIPGFQRSFRWQWEDVRRLLESIVRGYPIGSLLLWSKDAKSDTLTLGAIRVDAPALEDALWVVDGQQRLISLANTLSDAGYQDSRFGLAYDLEGKAFVKPAKERPHTIPLPVIFDLQRLLKWFADHPESLDFFDRATSVAKAIRQYGIPAYIVKGRDEAELQDIFDRMNNYGKRLTRAEIFAALHAAEGREGPPRSLADIVESIDSMLGFGRIDDDTVLHAILARRGPDVTRDIRTEFSGNGVAREFGEESVDESYRSGEEALGRAITFLQEDAGVPHFGFLAYRYLLVILTRFFAHHPDPARRNRELLRRWYWRTAIAGPEKFRGWTQAMRALTSRVDPVDEDGSVQALLAAVAPFDFRPPAAGTFRSTYASSRMLLCALWSLNPRSVVTGEPYGRPALSNALEGAKTAADVVYKIIQHEPDACRNLWANRCILLGDDSLDDARSRFTSPPLIMQPDSWEAVLRSHGLDASLSRCLGEGEDEDFLTRRQTLLGTITHSFLAEMAQVDLEDTPPLDSLDFDDETEVDDNEAEPFGEGEGWSDARA